MEWQLWRQDDNGQRYLVDIYSTMEKVETRMAELTRVLHKQTYWITEKVDTRHEQADHHHR